MGKEEANFLLVAVLVLLNLILGSAAASGDDSQQRWKKAMLSGETASSLMINRVGSSLVFPLHGNVYPAGYLLLFSSLFHASQFTYFSIPSLLLVIVQLF